MGVPKVNIIDSVMNLLVSPAEFFEHRRNSLRQSMVIPFALVSVVCLLTLLNSEIVHRDLFHLLDRSLALNSHLSEADRAVIENGLSSLRPLTLAVIVLSALAWLPYWLLTAILLANVAVLFGKDYQFKELMRHTGYGFAAFLPCLLLSTALLMIHPPSLSADAIVASRDIGEAQSAFLDVTKNLTASFPLTAVRNLTWAAIVWYEILVLFAFRSLYRAKWLPSLAVVGMAAAILNGTSWAAQRLFLS